MAMLFFFSRFVDHFDRRTTSACIFAATLLLSLIVRLPFYRNNHNNKIVSRRWTGSPLHIRARSQFWQAYAHAPNGTQTRVTSERGACAPRTNAPLEILYYCHVGVAHYMNVHSNISIAIACPTYSNRLSNDRIHKNCAAKCTQFITYVSCSKYVYLFNLDMIGGIKGGKKRIDKNEK